MRKARDLYLVVQLYLKRTLKHGKKVEPHFQEGIVAHKSNCYRFVGQNVVQI